MIGLLCLVGIHRPVWTPVSHAMMTAWAPPIRTCRDCGRPIGRTHRE